MDGRWSDPALGQQVETFDQANLNRMKILRVNTVAAGANDASGLAALSPQVAPLNVDPDGAPHFLMSPNTNDSAKSLGFEFGLVPIVGGATATAPGFTVTIWRLIEVLMQQGVGKQWLSFADLTSVNFNELYSSFDINASPLRFQIGNVDVDGPILIAFAEL